MAETPYRTAWVKGLPEAQRVFRALPDDMRETINAATEDTAVHVLAGARQRVARHRRYGFLERYLGYQMNAKTGVAKVGTPAKIALVIPGGVRASAGLRITQRIRRTDMRGRRKATFLVLGAGSAKGAQVIRPSKYAHLVEFGHRRGAGKSSAPPYPFMIPSAEGQRNDYVRRIREEVGKLEQTLAAKASGARVL